MRRFTYLRGAIRFFVALGRRALRRSRTRKTIFECLPYPIEFMQEFPTITVNLVALLALQMHITTIGCV